MQASQRALLEHVLDYAGLFPPARLSLDETIRNYSRCQREGDAWLLARLVCPVGRLEQLDPYITELFSADSPLRLSVLGQGGDTAGAFLKNLRLDLEHVQRFCQRHPGGAVIECFETRLPGDLVAGADRAATENHLAGATELFTIAGRGTLPRFYELPLIGDVQQSAQQLADTLANLGHGSAGLKLRCGGLEPAAVPSVAQVVAVIEASVAAEIPLKFTAGLHHVTRRLDPCVGVPVHGFLNLFAAGVLAYALGLDHEDLLAVIEEEDVREFRFSDDFFAWNDAEATVGEVAYARQHRVISFGSCSFDEPRDELRELGLI